MKRYIIAEIAQAHDGSLGMAHSYIDALKSSGVNAVKFQTHIANAESSIYEPFRIKFSKQDFTRFDYWKRMEFTENQWIELKKHCDDVGLEFISSPFSNKAVDLLEKIGVDKYKIGSGEVNNLLMLEKIAKTKKPILLSSGMSSFNEIDQAINLINRFGNEISILQCTTAYPTKPKEWGLNVILELKQKYDYKIGFSDHSGDIYACLAAATLGAEIFEFHVVFDKRQFGPDTKSSITIDQASKLVKGIDDIKKSLANKVDKNNIKRFSNLKNIFEKSLSVNKSLKKGHAISFNDLEAKKPSNMGIPASKYIEVIGKKINKNLQKWDFLNYDDI
tara:strand:+ start:94 stop:1092 length:999 start_codon:yes stop_codon:yes gene_type:complete